MPCRAHDPQPPVTPQSSAGFAAPSVPGREHEVSAPGVEPAPASGEWPPQPSGPQPQPPAVCPPSIQAEPLSVAGHEMQEAEAEVREETPYPSYGLNHHRRRPHLDRLSTDEEGWDWACSTSPVVQQYGGEDEGARRQRQLLVSMRS